MPRVGTAGSVFEAMRRQAVRVAPASRGTISAKTMGVTQRANYIHEPATIPLWDAYPLPSEIYDQGEAKPSLRSRNGRPVLREDEIDRLSPVSDGIS